MRDLTARNLAEAKETVGELLEQLGLTAYLFEVEPREDHWEVRVECAHNSAWQSSVFTVEDTALRASRTDRLVRDHMLSELHKRLTASDAATESH
jgi:hypothetical protein